MRSQVVLCSRGAPGCRSRRRSLRDGIRFARSARGGIGFARSARGRVPLIAPPITSGRLSTLAEERGRRAPPPR